jgi:manganese/iron transport system permease protein
VQLLTDPLQYAFMRAGLLEVLLLGVATGLVGVFVVQRQLTFFAHALSHTVFPAVVLAAVAGVDLTLGALVGAALTLGLVFRIGRQREVGHAGAVGVVLVVLFALGVILVGAFRVKSPDVGATLVGNIVGLSTGDVILSGVLVVGLGIVLRLLFWPLVLSSFDPVAASALGLPIGLLNLVVLSMVAATAVVGVRVVGVILTVAVLVVPAATALRWTRELRPAMALAGAIGSAAGVIGLYVAYYLPVAPAAIMVLVLSTAFAGSLFAEHLRTGRRQSAATRIGREEAS